MAGKDLGSKHVCCKCSTKFYDFKKPEPICPKCGADQRQAPVVKAPPAERRQKAPPKAVPAETEQTIRQTIEFSKKLPLDLALFHGAAPYPGTPFFFEVVKEGWFRPGTRWEQVDLDKGTVLDYPGLPAERLLYWQKRAWREWAFRPGPIFTYLKMLLSDLSTMDIHESFNCNPLLQRR